MKDIRQRYRRSRLGQFWISISTGVFIAGIGVLYAVLFKIPPQKYLPYLAVNYIVWLLMAGMANDSTAVFVEASAYLRQDALPKTIYIMRVLVRNLTIFAHNAVVIPLVFLIFGFKASPAMLLVIPGLALLLIAGFLIVLICSLLSTRFRDFPQIVQSALQVFFFATPVMWAPQQMGPVAWYFVHLNPFAIFLQLIAEPIRGNAPDLGTYVAAGIIIGVLLMVSLPFFVRYRGRVVYWL
ncbi:ABC transporter permease [Dyella silvatica]|uniref:ABC transporter permease n=1 Tax=Dyella silvatica TaxID=2992128 RepID=UPI0022575F99|nr:ABC transporter permease [Dyella silvatica]